MSDLLNTEKSLFQLGQEYEKHAELQQSFIDRCKADIKKAKASGDADAVSELEKKLHKFYQIKRELLETASHLKSYYKGEFYGK